MLPVYCIVSSKRHRYEVCNRSAHCEGINGRQPHDLSTLLLLAAPTRSAHGRAGATGSDRHKRVRCNLDKFIGAMCETVL
jgi:hypothetical protein